MGSSSATNPTKEFNEKNLTIKVHEVHGGKAHILWLCVWYRKLSVFQAKVMHLISYGWKTACFAYRFGIGG